MTRMIEILALGSGLRSEAARECGCLNESYFLVHQPNGRRHDTARTERAPARARPQPCLIDVNT